MFDSTHLWAILKLLLWIHDASFVSRTYFIKHADELMRFLFFEFR